MRFLWCAVLGTMFFCMEINTVLAKRVGQEEVLGLGWSKKDNMIVVADFTTTFVGTGRAISFLHKQT